MRLSLCPLKTVSMVTFGCPAACVLAGVTLNDEIPRSARAGLAKASRPSGTRRHAGFSPG